MELRIDGIRVAAAPGMTLLQMIRKLGLDTGLLSTRPIAAKMAG